MIIAFLQARRNVLSILTCSGTPCPLQLPLLVQGPAASCAGPAEHLMFAGLGSPGTEEPVVASKLEPGYLAVLLPNGDTVLLCVAVPVVRQQQAVRAVPCAADPATG